MTAGVTAGKSGAGGILRLSGASSQYPERPVNWADPPAAGADAV
jgi:hypothetical protein